MAGQHHRCGNLIPVATSLKECFGVANITLVADRGMVGEKNRGALEKAGFSYILGVKMRLEKKAMKEVLSRAGRFREVSGNLKVKEVRHEGKRYIVCVNPEEAKKDAFHRAAILVALEDKLKNGAKTLVGNSGYRRYLKIEKGSVTIDAAKVKQEARYDGKWVLITSTELSADEVALKYKDLWQVKTLFWTVKDVLATRPIYHQGDATIQGHVFISFLTLYLLKELRAQLGGACGWDEVR